MLLSRIAFTVNLSRVSCTLYLTVYLMLVGDYVWNGIKMSYRFRACVRFFVYYDQKKFKNKPVLLLFNRSAAI